MANYLNDASSPPWCGSAIYAAALHQGDRLQANSVVQKLGERDRVYVLTQTVPLQKKKTIFKKRLESHLNTSI